MELQVAFAGILAVIVLHRPLDVHGRDVLVEVDRACDRFAHVIDELELFCVALRVFVEVSGLDRNRDLSRGLRGFDRQAISNLGLVMPGMEFASEMVVKASLHGVCVPEVTAAST